MYIADLTPFWWGVYRWALLLFPFMLVLSAVGIKAIRKEILEGEDEE